MCDREAVWHGGRSDCPPLPDESLPLWHVDFGALWQTLKHPGIQWDGDPTPLLATAFWAVAALVILAVLFRIWRGRGNTGGAAAPVIDIGSKRRFRTGRHAS